MPTLKFGPKPKTAAERGRAYRQRQADKGACHLSLILDAETREKLDAIVEIRGGRKGGGKAGAIREAIETMHNVRVR